MKNTPLKNIAKRGITILLSVCVLISAAGPLACPAYGQSSSVSSRKVPLGNNVTKYQEVKDEDSGKHLKEFIFTDGSIFYIARMDNNRYQSPVDPEDGAAPDGDVNTEKLYLKGSGISIKIQNYTNRNNPVWTQITDTDFLPKATLFIETTEENMILSIPALYSGDFSHKTTTALKDKERSVRIERTADGYAIYLSFEKVPYSYGEYWYYKTTKNLFSAWDGEAQKFLLKQDLHDSRRFCIDGYYFQLPTTYSPYKPNGYFRHTANYTGAQLMEYDLSVPTRNLGYAMTKICIANQNELGYWPTGPMSTILNKDYGIGYDFYDNRFNADFAQSLVLGYQRFNDEEMLRSAKKYADFLVGYSHSLSYRVSGTKEGYLLPDYWAPGQRARPYVSLNHHLSELNFLLMIYGVTGNSHYGSVADSLLQGIKNTYKNWIMPDSNLKYALQYGPSSNHLVDYPFLTYNDLYTTRSLLQSMGRDYTEIQYLMNAKKSWMDKNGITEYKK